MYEEMEVPTMRDEEFKVKQQREQHVRRDLETRERRGKIKASIKAKKQNYRSNDGYKGKRTETGT